MDGHSHIYAQCEKQLALVFGEICFFHLSLMSVCEFYLMLLYRSFRAALYRPAPLASA